MRAAFTALLLSGSILHAPAALAQDQAAPPSASDEAQAASGQADANQTASADAGPTDIIVTAQRRSESLQRVPVSVTALTAETITSRNLNDLTQIARAAPTLQVGIDN